MKHFFIIRHGETEYNKLRLLQGRGINAPLNETGWLQAKAVANALESYPIEKIVTSSLIRTKQTAAPFAQRTHTEIESWSEFDEMSFGNFEGKPFFDVIEHLKELQEVWSNGQIDVEVPGGESPEEVYERAATKLIEIAESSAETHIAVFIHGRLIRILLSGILGYGLKNMQNIEHENGAINHITWEKGVFYANRLNMTEHLEHLKIDV
jgi:probable phosphoglycerate mutase